MSTPPIVMRPVVGCTSGASNKASSFFPLPPWPTTAMCSVERNREADPVENAAAVVLGERQVGHDREFAGERRQSFRLGHLQTGVDHPGGLELFYDLLVFDPRILLDLIKIEEFLPRRSQIFVCRQHRDQSAERKISADHQITADRIEEKRRKLSNEIVQKLDKELTLVNFEPYFVNRAEEVGKRVSCRLTASLAWISTIPAADS